MYGKLTLKGEAWMRKNGKREPSFKEKAGIFAKLTKLTSAKTISGINNKITKLIREEGGWARDETQKLRNVTSLQE